MIQANVISVSELTRQIREQLEQPKFMNIAVEGELSNFKHHTSGHMYFTLKDDRCRVKAVMFRNRNARLNFQPQNGDTVIAVGSLGIYEPNGDYQIYVDLLFPQGVGDLHIQFEQLKARLQQEGLFDSERKRSLPFFPQKIGVITSPTGAAIRDILSVIQRRCPCTEVLIIPAVVQGDGGPPSIIKAFEHVKKISDLDVVILARGGGSLEELWAFNDEGVARAIAQCPVPVISGVGHETDFTIADFVADHRAPTPSAAAELAVPDQQHLRQLVDGLKQRMTNSLRKQLSDGKRHLQYLINRNIFKRPLERVSQERQRIDELMTRAFMNVRHRYSILRQELVSAAGKLDSLSPLATLSRGYAVCQKSDGQVVVDVKQVQIGESVVVHLHRGRLDCLVQGGKSDG